MVVLLARSWCRFHKNGKLSHEIIIQFGFVASWQVFVMRRGRNISSLFTTMTCLRNSCFRRVLLLDIMVEFGRKVFLYNHLVDDEPLDLRMRVPPPTTKLDRLLVTVTGNQRKAVVPGPQHDGINPRGLEHWLEFQP
jgi:hypothetical protein